ncbi:hypothetical protein J0H58_12955 [bacterium]|nr:hypothetical protein [bacterium]
MTAKRFCIVGLVLYVVLSLTDLALTYLIVHAGIGYESNPVADAWLYLHGWAGLAAFKALTVVVFGATIALLTRHRPRTAGALVVVGCVALLLVVGHSRRMLDEGERPPPPAPPPFPTQGPVVRRLPAPEVPDAPEPRAQMRTARPMPPAGG